MCWFRTYHGSYQTHITEFVSGRHCRRCTVELLKINCVCSEWTILKLYLYRDFWSNKFIDRTWNSLNKTNVDRRSAYFSRKSDMLGVFSYAFLIVFKIPIAILWKLTSKFQLPLMNTAVVSLCICKAAYVNMANLGCAQNNDDAWHTHKVNRFAEHLKFNYVFYVRFNLDCTSSHFVP